MGAKSTAQRLLEGFGELRNKHGNPHLFFSSLVRNKEDRFSRGMDAVFRRIACGGNGGGFFAEIIDAALKNAKELHEVSHPLSWSPLKNNLRGASSILVKREETIKSGRTKGQQRRRPDFLISANNYCLGMEMKIDTADSRDQIAKYIQYLGKFDVGEKSYRGALLYVTMDGVMPRDGNKKIPDLRRVLPLSWADLASIAERHLEKAGKKYADSVAALRFLDYAREYAYQEVPEEIRNWIVANLSGIDGQWKAMAGLKEPEGVFLELQKAILSILTVIYRHIGGTIRKNMPEGIEFDDLLPKTLDFNYFSSPSFFASGWCDREANNNPKFYYYFSDGNKTKPSPPGALVSLIDGDPAIYLVSRFSGPAKALRAAMDRIFGESCSGSLPRWKSEQAVYRFPFVKFRKEELTGKNPFSGDAGENPKRAEQVKEFWRGHKKIVTCIDTF